MKIYFDGVPFAKRHLLKKVLSFAVTFLGQPKNIELNITYTSEENIKEINKNQRGIDKVTDVLSFPTLQLQPFEIIKENADIDKNPYTGNIMLGDIVVCPSIAKLQAKEYGHGFKRELAYEVLHGFLHLNGFDHMVEEEEKQMTQTAERILSQLNILR